MSYIVRTKDQSDGMPCDYFGAWHRELPVITVNEDYAMVFAGKAMAEHVAKTLDTLRIASFPARNPEPIWEVQEYVYRPSEE